MSGDIDLFTTFLSKFFKSIYNIDLMSGDIDVLVCLTEFFLILLSSNPIHINPKLHENEYAQDSSSDSSLLCYTQKNWKIKKGFQILLYFIISIHSSNFEYLFIYFSSNSFLFIIFLIKSPNLNIERIFHFHKIKRNFCYANNNYHIWRFISITTGFLVFLIIQ